MLSYLAKLERSQKLYHSIKTKHTIPTNNVSINKKLMATERRAAATVGGDTTY